ncbi:uncharacterized protein N0V89_003035 [Didymosphaeria variabile]|uniref:Uncharacterized protein n=1 Tax=Didymosphaeria variabile TaxID=1932322 RepID=A0A9W8XSS2_9PLEO|nr:uncharacterized protein N0V89_003035 [Didymosphaeria variabile]KAJ4358452.1 hypothetical protein N0V89_003035 [Didymosphaeria variabile]
MDAALATEPIPKKRGRPRKVVSDDAPTVEPKKSVRKASTKTAAAAKEEAPKKVAKATKTPAKATTKTTATKATKATKAATAPKTASAPKSAPSAKIPSATKTEQKVIETPKVEDKPTPVTPSTSKILEEVYKTGTVKPPATGPAPENEVMLPTGGVANVTMEQPIHTPPTLSETVPEVQLPTLTPSASSAPQPSPTPTAIPPTSSTSSQPRHLAHPSLDPPRQPQPQPRNPPTKTHLPPAETNNNPLPTHPLNPSKPAHPRPKPISPEELEKAANERHINEGRMPPKYKGAARRVTTILVGIPVILVVGWDLYKRYDAEIRTKFDVEGKRVDS